MKIKLKHLPIFVFILFTACKEEDHSDNFTGLFSINETCVASDDFFEIAITSDDPNKIAIENFSRWDETVIATIDNAEDFTIEKLEVNGFSLEGDGTIFGNSIIISYQIRRDNWSDVCNFVGVK